MKVLFLIAMLIFIGCEENKITCVDDQLYKAVKDFSQEKVDGFNEAMSGSIETISWLMAEKNSIQEKKLENKSIECSAVISIDYKVANNFKYSFTKMFLESVSENVVELKNGNHRVTLKINYDAFIKSNGDLSYNINR